MRGRTLVIIAALLLVLFCGYAGAGETYLAGYVVNMTSLPEGLMIMLDTGVPDNCEGTPYGWMIIPEDNKTMVAVAMMAYLQSDREITLCTDGSFYSGYCRVNQAHLLPKN